MFGAIPRILSLATSRIHHSLTIPDPPFARLLVLRTVSSAIWAIAWNTVSPWYVESFGT